MSTERLQELRKMVSCDAGAGSVEDLQIWITELPALCENVRKGALEKIEAGRREALKHHAIAILHRVDPKEGDVEKVNTLWKGLPFFDTKRGILDLVTKITKWQSGNEIS